MSKKSKNKALVALGAFAGGILAGVLYAPRSGKETRDMLNEQAKEAGEKVAEKAKVIAEEAKVVAKDSVSKAKVVAEDSVQKAKAIAEEAKVVAKDSMQKAQGAWESTKTSVQKNIHNIDQEIHWDKSIGENLTKAVDEVVGGKA